MNTLSLWFCIVSMVEHKLFNYQYLGKLANPNKKNFMNFGKPKIKSGCNAARNTYITWDSKATIFQPCLERVPSLQQEVWATGISITNSNLESRVLFFAQTDFCPNKHEIYVKKSLLLPLITLILYIIFPKYFMCGNFMTLLME